MDQYKILLEDILVSQVLTLASQLKEEKREKESHQQAILSMKPLT